MAREITRKMARKIIPDSGASKKLAGFLFKNVEKLSNLVFKYKHLFGLPEYIAAIFNVETTSTLRHCGSRPIYGLLPAL
jgi:hypothetical protein